MEIPAPDAGKLLHSWMEWERGEETPGRVMANLKTGGLRQLLEELAGQAQPVPPKAAVTAPGEHPTAAADGEDVASKWTPIV